MATAVEPNKKVPIEEEIKQQSFPSVQLALNGKPIFFAKFFSHRKSHSGNARYERAIFQHQEKRKRGEIQGATYYRAHTLPQPRMAKTDFSTRRKRR